MPSDALTVSQFVDAVNTVFSEFGSVTVEGEVAEYKVSQGKWVRFKLKDEECTIDCFMPIWNLKTQVEDGMLIQATGVPKLLTWGSFSFNLTHVRPSGEGALKRAFELLRAKLEQEGLFAQDRKRSLPQFPEHIALITSPEAAAYSDFLKVLAGRRGGLTISVIPSQVQGEPAPMQLTQAIEIANTELPNLDAIVMVRGGGSFEDLQAFNDEALVRAVAASRTPIVVGVGHERDVTLAELAADVRASTPSNSAELLVQSRQELASVIATLQSNLAAAMTQTIHERQQAAQHFTYTLISQLQAAAIHVNKTIQSMQHIGEALSDHIVSERDRLRALSRVLQSLSPEHIMRRGYSITKTRDGSVIKRAADVPIDSEVVTVVYDGSFQSRVSQIDS